MKLFRLLGLISFLVILNSCSTKKEILYFQDYENIPKDVINFSPQIQINDILSINVNSLIAEAAIPYNRNISSQGGAGSQEARPLKSIGYLVSSDGTITFPILGSITATGKTTKELESDITKILVNEGHLKNPTVIVSVINAKITVLGEVGSPGTITFEEETVTLPQAIGMAGDLTINGVREDILIIREVDGVRTVGHVDMTKTDWFTSEFYNLRQNDIILVNPNGPAVKQAGYITNIAGVFGVVSFILTLVLLIKS
ncbi:polysaccharide biosynthesis/export family protein [Formosa sp. 3Alg 14/1]|uniref:polysaccharide biosynthesis/export family protein n=1 Tax=Formosa sp. 3Alg 14/1 TaxID=3382190 RepID=UPI0039BE51E8